MKTRSFRRIGLICACATAALLGCTWLAGETTIEQSVNAAYGDEPDFVEDFWTLRCETDPNTTNRAEIMLTKCEITETAIHIAYEITNASDHEIWVCDGIIEGTPSSSYFEVGLDAPAQTLFVKKHINIPVINSVDWIVPPFGVYLRILPGEKHLGSFSQSLPLHRRWSFRTECDVPGIIDLTRIVVDIHYYDGNLPELIRSILTEADRFTGTLSSGWQDSYDTERILKYFPGLVLKAAVGGLDNFNRWQGNRILNGKLEMAFSQYQFLRDDDVLRLTLDGVCIPFEFR